MHVISIGLHRLYIVQNSCRLSPWHVVIIRPPNSIVLAAKIWPGNWGEPGNVITGEDVMVIE